MLGEVLSDYQVNSGYFKSVYFRSGYDSLCNIRTG